MKILITLILTAFYINPSFASYPLHDYELVVVESLPESLSLSMSLGQIAEAKDQSRIQGYKNKLYSVLTKNITPLLNSANFAKNYSLYDLATQIPLQKIINEMTTGTDPLEGLRPSADFMVLILPKLTASQSQTRLKKWGHFYSKSKAAVIDTTPDIYGNLNHDDLINTRILKAIEFAYQRNYQELESNQAFFVGALLHIHIAGPNSQIKLQIVGGLPTDQAYDFDQKEKEAHFRKIKTPKTPRFKLLSNDYPGTIIELVYNKSSDRPAMLKLTFGSLGINDWQLRDGPSQFKDLYLGTDSFGVTSLMKRFNVPNLYGDILDLSGYGFIDAGLASTYDIQINIHEVEIDLTRVEISEMRVTAELPVKEFLWLIEPGLRLPTFELLSLNEKFRVAGNDALAPYRDQIQTVLNDGPLNILNNPKIQKTILETLLGIYEVRSGGLH